MAGTGNHPPRLAAPECLRNPLGAQRQGGRVRVLDVRRDLEAVAHSPLTWTTIVTASAAGMDGAANGHG